MGEPKTAALFYEMLRSFTVLAKELNLSRTVSRLNSTRQTVRRHIRALEEYRGTELFSVNDRQYALTDAGRDALEGALDIVALSDAWMKNQSGQVRGLDQLRSKKTNGHYYHLQQQPISRIWNTGPALLRNCFNAWVASQGRIEAPEFQAVRAAVVIFRRLGEEWICVEVGAESSYSSWFGRDWALSSIGLKSADLPGGQGFGRLLVAPFEEVKRTEGVRLDHIVSELPREKGGAPVPISYQRLLLGCRFPDQSRGLVSVVVRTYDLCIDGLPREEIERMPSELLMDIR